MKFQYKIVFSVVVLLLSVGCEPEDEFLESDFVGVVSLNRVNDYNELLNGTTLSNDQFGENYPNTYMSDDVNFSSFRLGQVSESLFAAYSWESSIYPQGTNPLSWTTSYYKIFTYNTIINEIDDAVDSGNSVETTLIAKRVKAEAFLGRAFEHLILVNLYAQPYSNETLNTPGIPYMEVADITQPAPPRETLADTYNKIEADVLAAIPDLPDLPIENNTRGSKIAAYGVLARMYLFTQQYDKVIEYTDRALNIQNDLSDYTTPFFILPRPIEDTDVVYSRGLSQGELFFETPSSELLNLYSIDDVRNDVYFFFGSFGFPFFIIEHGITLPELVLAKAEAHARQNQLAEALVLLNNLRSKRIGNFVELSSMNQEEVLTWVLEERRRDLVNNGLRFSDMRRLQLEGRIGTITHELLDGEIATLEEGSPRYTLAIPDAVLSKNPGMEQNPR